MTYMSPSWVTCSDSNCSSSSRQLSEPYVEHCEDISATYRTTHGGVACSNMPPNFKNKYLASDSGSESSPGGGAPLFSPNPNIVKHANGRTGAGAGGAGGGTGGNGGVPVVPQTPTPDKVTRAEKRSSAQAFTPNQGAGLGMAPIVQPRPAAVGNHRNFENTRAASQSSSNNKVKPDPVTPVRSTSLSQQRNITWGYGNNSSVSSASGFYPIDQAAAGATATGTTAGATAGKASGSLSLIPSIGSLADEKNQHPAYLSIRNHCVMGHGRIHALRQALMAREDVDSEVGSLLDMDMQQFSNLLAAILKQADLLANTLDEQSEQHDTLKKMLATQTVESENLAIRLSALDDEKQKAVTELGGIRRQHAYEITKLQEQLKPSPFGGPTFGGDKPFFESQQIGEPLNNNHNPHAHRHHHQLGPANNNNNPTFNFGGGSGPVASPDFVRQTPANMGMAYPHQPRSVSYAPPPKFGPMSTRKSSGFKTSGQARFNFDEDTPTRTGSGMYRDNSGDLAGLQAMVPRGPPSKEDQLVAEWAERFSKMFGMVLGWCKSYVTGDNATLHEYLQRSAPNLWQYVCDVLYPNQPSTNGAAHARFLLSDVESRAFLVERLVIQYIVNHMWCIDGWLGFDKETDDSLRDTEQRLRNLDSYKVAERQALLETQGQLVARILTHARFQEFRQYKATFHCDRVKLIVGPMLPTIKARQESQWDLFSIVTSAMELSACMFQGRRLFSFIWNDTCAKFAAENHNALDNMMPPMTLQVRQWRLKLVITPGIAVRDERNPAIVRRVLKSDVMVMS